jgi:uncharacterized protein YaiL (DUF2058 family)
LSATAFQRRRRELAKQRELQKQKELEKQKEKVNQEKIETMTVKELREMAKEKEIDGYYNMKKDELIQALKG